MKVVTTMSDDGYAKYGRRMLETFIHYWPVDAPITVYTEDDPSGWYDADGQIDFADLHQVPGFDQFIDVTARLPLFRGVQGGRYNYRFNAHAFSRKIFALCAAANDYGGKLVWLDADTEYTAPVPEDWIEELCPPDMAIAYMGRPDWHSCASFFILNCGHPAAAAYVQILYNLHVSGEIFALPEWHDSYIHDVVRRSLKVPAVNVAAEYAGELKGPANVFNYVFGVRGRHFKGNMKNSPQRYRELLDRAAQMPQFERWMEIGVWRGDRAVEIAQLYPNAEYVGFDLFESATAETDEREKNVKPHFAGQDVAQRLEDNKIRAMLVGGDTRETLPAFAAEHPEVKADLIFIDGGHSVDTIQSDFLNAQRMVSERGWIVFDDYYHGEEIDTDKYGCNKIVDSLDPAGWVIEPGEYLDPVQGGGEVSIVAVRRRARHQDAVNLTPTTGQTESAK